METRSLEDLIGDAGGPLNLLRAHTYDRAGSQRRTFSPPQIIPQIPRRFRSRNMRRWLGVVGCPVDQVHHMQGLVLEGPDAQPLLTWLACNDLSRSRPNSAYS